MSLDNQDNGNLNGRRGFRILCQKDGQVLEVSSEKMELLMENSEYFERMFSGSMKEAQSRELSKHWTKDQAELIVSFVLHTAVKDVQPKDFHTLLSFANEIMAEPYVRLTPPWYNTWCLEHSEDLDRFEDSPCLMILVEHKKIKNVIDEALAEGMLILPSEPIYVGTFKLRDKEAKYEHESWYYGRLLSPFLTMVLFAIRFDREASPGEAWDWLAPRLDLIKTNTDKPESMEMRLRMRYFGSKDVEILKFLGEFTNMLGLTMVELKNEDEILDVRFSKGTTKDYKQVFEGILPYLVKEESGVTFHIQNPTKETISQLLRSGKFAVNLNKGEVFKCGTCAVFEDFFVSALNNTTDAAIGSRCPLVEVGTLEEI